MLNRDLFPDQPEDRQTTLDRSKFPDQAEPKEQGHQARLLDLVPAFMEQFTQPRLTPGGRAAQAARYGALPIGGEEARQSAAEYPVMQGAGQLGGLIAASALTGGAGPAVMQKLPSAVPAVGRYVAGRAAGGAATLGAKAAADSVARAIGGEDVTLGESVADTAKGVASGAGFGVVGSIADPKLRIPAQAAYGFVRSKLDGADNINAGINAGVMGVLGLFNMKHLDPQYKAAAYVGSVKSIEDGLVNSGVPQKKAAEVAQRFVDRGISRAGGYDKVGIKQMDEFRKGVRDIMSKKPAKPFDPQVKVQDVPAKDMLPAPAPAPVKDVQPVAPVKPYVPVKPVTPDAPLLAEAKKYSTVDEFVEANIGAGGDYGMSHRPTFTGATADNVTQDVSDMGLPKDFYEHPEYYLSGNEAADRESLSVLNKVRGNPESEITIYRAGPTEELNVGDWVTLSKEYAKGEALQEDVPVHSFTVKAKDIHFAGDDINEFGYYPADEVKRLKSIYQQAHAEPPVEVTPPPPPAEGTAEAVPGIKPVKTTYQPSDYDPQDMEMVMRQVDRIEASKYLGDAKKLELIENIYARLKGEHVAEGGSELESIEAQIQAYKGWKSDIYLNIDKAIRELGGIRPYASGAERLEYRDIPQRYKKRGDQAKDPDRMREALQEMGYNVPDTHTLYDILDDLGRSKGWKDPAWLGAAKERVQELKARHAEIRRLDSKGVLPKSQAKKTIREATGQIKVKTAIETTEEDLYKMVLKERQTAAREAARATKKDVTQSLKAEQRMRDEIRREARRVSQDTKKMLDHIRKVKTDKFSPVQKESIESIKQMLDFSVPTKKTRLRLEATREYLKNHEDAELPDYVMDQLTRLDKVNRSDLTFEELEALYTAVKHSEHLEQLKKKLRVKQQIRTFNQVKGDSIAEMRPLDEIAQDAVVESLPPELAGKKQWGRTIGRLFTVNQDHYDLMIETFFGGENTTSFDVLFNQVKDGRRAELAFRHRLQDMVHDYIDSLDLGIEDMGKWRTEKIKTGKFNLTRDERMAIYLHAKNDNNIRHIRGGGIVLPTKPLDPPHRVSDEDIDMILDSLSGEEVSIAEVNAPISELIYDELNKVFYQKNGYELPKEDNYFGIKIARTGMPAKIEESSIMDELKRDHVRIGLSKGFLNKRRQSTLPLELRGFFDQLSDHIHHAAAYVGLEIPLSNAARLINNQEWKAEFQHRYSPEDWKLIHKGLRDIAGDWDVGSEMDTVFNQAKNKYTPAVYGLNPGIIASQALSMPLYAVYVKPEYVIQGFLEYQLNKDAIVERHRTFSPEFRQRTEFGFHRDVADVYRGKRAEKLARDKKGLSERFMGGIQWMDKETVSAGMHGAVLHKLDELKDSGLSATEKLKQAYEWADYVTNRTQPTFAPEHRSTLSRNPDMASRSFTFATAATEQQLNLLRRTWRQYQRTKSKADKDKFLAAMLGVMVIVPICKMFLDETIDVLYRRRDYKFSPGRMAGRIPSTWAGNLAIFRDLYRSVQSKVERGTWAGHDVEFPVMTFANLGGDMISETLRAFIQFGEGETGKGIKSLGSAIDKSLEFYLMQRGLPYRTPKRIIQRVGDMFAGDQQKPARRHNNRLQRRMDGIDRRLRRPLGR